MMCCIRRMTRALPAAASGAACAVCASTRAAPACPRAALWAGSAVDVYSTATVDRRTVVARACSTQQP